MQESCTVSQTVRYLSKRWTLLIILELYKGEGYSRRFSELRDALPGITPKVLSERLKELDIEEIITRTVDATAFPVRTEYTLTESGLEIIEIIRDIKRWALKWKIDNITCKSQDCKECVL
ncbi:MAG TPA: helix-turn-helix domain-containing protein [Methanoregulaceae archaeon]|nr:MAG: helix-turn-helix transcriptional regulator [Methanolinea sp.]HON80946.1 helix-turn-helix domain-containing protein [Methanoregulaceae archaeon]HPD09684.1 helix-turn-helix domain-containing protein [Methanoregulaceae archaeon]HRT15718.1 helix-turn-helix domain-containing protein [Methanoregulaceae archaeon]HRU31202.1 helix-turn-helix domain-containing protein [Methanoregulaceae archaeon]